MTAPLRTIEVDETTAARLADAAAEEGLTVPELLAELAAALAGEEPEEIARMRHAGEGLWSPEETAETDRRLAAFERTRQGAPWEEVKAWMESWGTDNELSPPKPRRV
jgi:hypothetical protein